MDGTSEHCREKICQSISRLSSTTSLKSDTDLQQMLHEKKIRSRYMGFEPLPPADGTETEMWKRAISVHWDDLDDRLRKEYVDFVIFYSNANVTEAEAFKNHLQNIYSEKDLRIRLLNRKWYQTQKEFDSFSFKTHENSPVTECLSCLVFLSKEFCETDWPELSTRDFFTEALYGKKQLIFPVMPQNPKTADFRVPMGLNQLTEIQYYKKDDHLYRKKILGLMREQVQKIEKSESELFTAQCEFVYEQFIKENTSNRESTGSEYLWSKDMSDNGDLNSGLQRNIESSEDEFSMVLDNLLPGNPLPSLTRLPAYQPLSPKDLSVPVHQGYAQMDRRDQSSPKDSIPSEKPVVQAQRPKPTKIYRNFLNFPANDEPLSAVNSISDDSNASSQPVLDCGESQNTISTASEMSSYCEKHGPVKVDQIRLPPIGTPEIDGTLNSLWHETPSPDRANPGYNQLGQNITTPLCERGATNALSQSGLQVEDQKAGNEIERALNKRANVNINLYITTATNVQIGDKARVDNSVTSGTNDPGHHVSAKLTNIENGNYVSRESKLDSKPTVDCGQGGASHTETGENKGMQPNNITENSTASQALAEETKKSNLSVGTLKPMMSLGSQQSRDGLPEDPEDDSITYVKQMNQSSGQGIDDSERSTGTTAVKSHSCDASKAIRVENKTANEKSIKATQVVENSANDKNTATHVKDKNNYDKSKAMDDVDKTTFNKSKATHDVVETTYDKSKATVAIDKEYNQEMLKATERAKQNDDVHRSHSDMPNPPYNKKPWNQTEKRKPLQQTNRNRAVGLVKPIRHQKPMTSSSTETEVQCNTVSANDDDDNDNDDVNYYNNILSTQPRNEETEVKDAAGDTEETVVKEVQW